MTKRYEALEEGRECLPPEPGTTGRYVVTLDRTKGQQGLDILREIGVAPNTIVEGAEGDVDAAQLNDQRATIYFKFLGIVVVGCVSREQLEQIRSAAGANSPVR